MVTARAGKRHARAPGGPFRPENDTSCCRAWSSDWFFAASSPLNNFSVLLFLDRINRIVQDYFLFFSSFRMKLEKPNPLSAE
jgi:hypothetical protein